MPDTMDKPRKTIQLDPGDGSVEARGAAVAGMVTSPEVSTPTNSVRFFAEYFVPQLTGNSLRFSGIRL